MAILEMLGLMPKLEGVMANAEIREVRANMKKLIIFYFFFAVVKTYGLAGSGLPYKDFFKEKNVFEGVKLIADWDDIRKNLRAEAIQFRNSLDPKAKRPSRPGQLVLPESGRTVSYEVRIFLRGQSGLQELDFPELSLEFYKGKVPPLWQGLEKISLLTHGFLDPEIPPVSDRWTGIGRLKSSRSVYREATALEFVKELDLLSRGLRRSKIEYIYTDLEKRVGNGPLPGVFLEPMKKYAESIGGKIIPLEDLAFEKVQNFDDVRVAYITMVEALLGNWDYGIPTSEELGESVHNMEVIRFYREGTFIFDFIIEDFDVASIVTEKTKLENLPPDFMSGEKDEIKIYLADQLQQARERFSDEAWQEARKQIRPKKERLLKLLDQSLIDKEGLENFRHHVDVFFSLLEKEVED